MTSIDRTSYAARYGPTAGDRIRLGDTSLFALIERDDAAYGDELLRGWGKTVRVGIQLRGETSPSELDLLISNAVVMDPTLGVFKSNIGIKDGLIAGIGRAGNPDISDGVELVLGPNTAHLPAHGLIATPGAVDAHVHLKTPRLADVALSSGTTTLITAGLEENPAANLIRAFESFEGLPLNLGIQGRASSYRPEPMAALLESGACGLKIHEDYAAYPTVIDASLQAAQEYDVAVALHTDGLNESGDVAETIAAIDGRAIHVYHIEGVGGGHIPDSLSLSSLEHVLGSSTTPTVPYGVNAAAEHRGMMWVVHGMNRAVPSNHLMLDGRVREWTMQAESFLHEVGAICMITSDSLGMGRIGEVARRTWQLAHMMSFLDPIEPELRDNSRIRKYLAKYTINPALTHGISKYVGSLEPGKIADIVLWNPKFFGVKPDMVIKGGHPAWGVAGSGAASVQLAEPVVYRADWGGTGAAAARTSVNFVSDASLLNPEIAGLNRKALSVAGARGIRKASMILNTATPSVTIDPAEQRVIVDGQPVPPLPVEDLPLNRVYILS